MPSRRRFLLGASAALPLAVPALVAVASEADPAIAVAAEFLALHKEVNAPGSPDEGEPGCRIPEFLERGEALPFAKPTTPTGWALLAQACATYWKHCLVEPGDVAPLLISAAELMRVDPGCLRDVAFDGPAQRET